jgi:hypothetical protein
VHNYLCDPPEDAKRSCSTRIADLLEGMKELGPRAPRTKKDKSDKAEKTEKPAAAK